MSIPGLKQTKPAAGIKLCVHVCGCCVCVCGATTALSKHIKVTADSNCLYCTLLSCHDEKETLQALISVISSVSVNLKLHVVGPNTPMY